MAADNVFPAEMPDHAFHPTVPLDDDTAERLLAGRLHPEDAPPGYAEVARLLRMAAGPPNPEELAGEEGALGMFRAARRPGPVGARRRPAPVRSRVVALTLAGTLVAGALWVGGGVVTVGGSGTGVPAAGSGVAGGSRPAGGAESLRPATGPLAGDQAPSWPRAGGRPADRDNRGVTGRGGGAAHGVGPGPHGKPSKDQPPEKKPPRDEAGKGKPKVEPGKDKPPRR
jgi:hypothetical protein